MPQNLIYFSDDEDETVIQYSRRWKLTKHDTIKKMIRIFGKKLKSENKGEQNAI